MKRSSQYLSALFVAITLVGGLAGCASTSRQEGTAEYLDDSVITGKVKAALFNEPGLKTSEINVETFKGIVQLSGFVGSEDEMRRAIEVTQNVKGVKSVKDDMRLK